MNKIKILVDGVSVHIGGIGTILNDIINKLNKEIFDVTVLFTYDSVYEKELIKNGIKIEKICPLGKNPFKYKRELKQVYEKGHFDYVWINNTGKVNVTIFKLAKKYGVKTIAHSHGEKQEWSTKQKIILGTIERLNQRAFYKNMDIAIACSDNSAAFFYNPKRMKGKPIHVLDNAVDLEKFAFDMDARKKYREELGCKDKIAVVAVGRMSVVKNHTLLIEAFNKLKDDDKYKLYIIGRGELKTELEAKIAEYHLEDRVVLLGVRSDVPKILSAFDAYALPSLNEGYCVSLIEGYANGLKCLVSNTVKRPHYEDNIYLDINNVDEWVNAIKSLNYRKMSDNVDAMIDQGLDLSCMVKKFEKILLENM